MGAIGLRSGTWAFPWDLMNQHFINLVGADGDWASCRSTNAEVFPLRDPVAGVPFHFVTVADFSPYAMRREAFLDIGGSCAPAPNRISADYFVASLGFSAPINPQPTQQRHALVVTLCCAVPATLRGFSYPCLSVHVQG
jgi:hypothetical protein